MNNPVIIEVTRGRHVESSHRGAFVIADADGGVIRSAGEIAKPVFPRSSVKAIQALPLVETGAADNFGFGEAELAIAQGSHCGEPGHVELAARMLSAAGYGEADLECGPQWPSRHQAKIELAQSGGQPNQLFNNCSGKHAGFLCVCKHCSIEKDGYVKAEHAFQAMVRDVLEDVIGYPHSADDCGYDGCSIPTYPVPLSNLARGFARMVTGQGLTAQRAAAASRLLKAGMAKPWYVDGTGRSCSEVMTLANGRIYQKTGAEGVCCAAIPQMGLGIALKIDDGANRAAEAAMAAILAKVFEKDGELSAGLSDQAVVPVKNRNGRRIGEIRPAGPLA